MHDEVVSIIGDAELDSIEMSATLTIIRFQKLFSIVFSLLKGSKILHLPTLPEVMRKRSQFAKHLNTRDC